MSTNTDEQLYGSSLRMLLRVDATLGGAQVLQLAQTPSSSMLTSRS
jgi:hypothetical protein